MPKMIQVRHVPDELHATLKARAARSQTTLSGYILRELEKIAEIPSTAEFLEMLSAREPVDPEMSSAEAIRLERDSR